MSDLSSVSRRTRDSNMDLLRIIAMLMVMIFHADFKTLGYPSANEAIIYPVSTFLRFFIEYSTLICVNVFVLISGWYGIHYKTEKLLSFIFQILFFSVFIYIYALIAGYGDSPTIPVIIKLLSFSQYWFAISYLVLYTFSPILNTFVDSAPRNVIKKFLIVFFILQTIYGWLPYVEQSWFNYGFSPLSFLGLYVLGRYLRLFPSKFTSFDRNFDLFIYLVVTLVTAASAFFILRHGGKLINLVYEFNFYTSPLAIVASVFFLLLFSKLRFTSRFISWIAVSCFTVYLLHSSEYFFGHYYSCYISKWFKSCDTLTFLINTFIFILSLYCLAIIVDKLRIVIWNQIVKLKVRVCS